MIPLSYRLRAGVAFDTTAEGKQRVVCSLPLSVMSVNAGAVRMLEAARQGATVTRLATAVGTDEERVLRLCERFRSRGILEVVGAQADPAWAPRVSVVIPTKDRPDDLADCLGALALLDYPPDLLEVIVVDDGSERPDVTESVAARYGARFLANEGNQGQSYSRNRAAREAGGEILAFIDSDCVAEQGWLRDLVPYFAWQAAVAVGGRVAGYYDRSRLDRYEQVASPLDMGGHVLLAAAGTDTFYVPTCNLLVRRTAYLALGGLREELRVGEDVDLCWRLRAAGGYLIYAAAGTVRHKHRARLSAMLRRRAEYGTSEAPLHSLHPDKRKRFPMAFAPLASVIALSAALILLQPWLLLATLGPPLWEGMRRSMRLRRAGVHVPTRRVWFAVARGHLSMLHFVLFHLVRYYLVVLAGIGLLVHGVWLFAAVALVYVSAIDYWIRRPRLSYPVFLGFFMAEHVAYQIGVAVGCGRAGSARSYLPAHARGRVTTRVSPASPPPSAPR